MNRRLEGVGIKTTPAGEIDVGTFPLRQPPPPNMSARTARWLNDLTQFPDVDARTAQKYGLLKPEDVIATGRSAQAMSSKGGDAFARRFDELRAQRSHYRAGEMLGRGDPKEKRAYDKSQRRLNRRHDPLYTGAAKRKHIKRRLLNIAQANRDAGREQLLEDPEGNRPGYSSSPWDYLPYPQVRSKLDIIRNQAYDQGTGKWKKREDEELPW